MLSDFQNQQLSDKNIQLHFLVIDGSDNTRPLKYSYDKYKSQKPRRNKSAFLLFSAEKRAQIKAQEGGKLNSNQIMAKLADLWNNLPQKDRRKFETAAKKDKERYRKEMDAFKRENPAAKDSHNRTKKNHVKKPSSAYGLFLKDVTSEIKKESPKLLMADVLKVVAQKWKNLGASEKARYQERAQKEKEMSQAQLGYKLLKDHHMIDIETLVGQAKGNNLEKIIKKVRRDTSDSISTNSNSQSQTTPSYESVSHEDFFQTQGSLQCIDFDAFDDGFLSPAPHYTQPNFEMTQVTEVHEPVTHLPASQEQISHLPSTQEWALPIASNVALQREASKEVNGLCEMPDLSSNLRSFSGLSMFNDGVNLLKSDSFNSFVLNSPKLTLTSFPSMNFSQDLSLQGNWMNSFQN